MKVKYICVIFFILFANVALAKKKINDYTYEEIKASIPNFNNLSTIQKKDALITFYKQAQINLDNNLHTPRVNNVIHQFLNEHVTFQNDNSPKNISYHQEDYWASVNESLNNGFGDCEDFVTLYYHMYQQLGMDPSRMAFGYLIDKRKNNYPAHMVLLIYDENFKESPRFLDVLQSSGIASSMSFNDQLAKFDNFDATYAFFSKDRAFELDPETAVLLRPIKVKTKVSNSNSSQGIETQDRKEFTFDNIHSNLDKVVSDLMFLAKEGPTPLISKDDCL